MASPRACTRTRKRNPKLPLWTGEVISRESLPSPKELKLQFSVAKFLKGYCYADWRYTHFPAGELRDAKTGAKLKRMGLKAGWPDFQIVSPKGLFHALELKRVGEDLNDNQDEFAAWCCAHGIPHAVVNTFKDAVKVLNDWGCLRIKFSEVR
jgi:hypothetical protein